MTDYSTIDFSPLSALSDDEVVTHSFVRDIPLSGGKVLALVTLDNGRDHTRPNTFGPATLLELGETFDALTERAATRRDPRRRRRRASRSSSRPAPTSARSATSRTRDIAKQLAQLGHYVLGKQATLGVPSFVFINGLALGGGVEIRLNADYRTIDRSAAAFALPEVFLGLIPGWGGTYLLPNLIGIENALKVIIENPLKQNRMLKAAGRLRPRHRRRDLRLGELPRGLDQVGRRSSPVSHREAPERPGQARAHGQVGCRHRHRPQDAREPHRHRAEVAVRRARPAQGRQERHQGGVLRARGRRSRRPHRRRPAPGQHLRLQPRAEARQAPGRRARQDARQEGHEGRRDRRRLHGQPVRPAVRAPSAGARGHHRPRPGARRQGRRVHPRRDRQAAGEGPHLAG